MASVNMPRRPKRLTPALCLACFAAYGALGHLSFIDGITWGKQDAKRATERFNWRGGQVPETPAEDARALSIKLTSRIKKAQSAKALIEVLDEILDGPFDFYQASSSYHSLATWKRRRGLQRSDWDSPVISRLHARVGDLVLEDKLGARELANVLWSIATLSDRFSIPTELLDALVKSMPRKAKSMKPQELSNSLWAFAQLKAAAPAVLEVVPAISAEIAGQAEGMKLQELSNSLWACARLREVVPDVLEAVPAIAVQILDKAKHMPPQSLSNSLWACGQFKNDAPEVLEIVPALLAEVSTKIKDMKAQEMQDSLQALVPLRELVPEVARPSVDIVRFAATRFTTLLPSLSGMDLSIAVPAAVWACAKLGVYHEELLLSVAQHLESGSKFSKLPRFSLCALAWSYQVLDAQGDFADFRSLLELETMRRGFSEADIESTRLGHLQWNHAQLRERGPARG